MVRGLMTKMRHSVIQVTLQRLEVASYNAIWCFGRSLELRVHNIPSIGFPALTFFQEPEECLKLVPGVC